MCRRARRRATPRELPRCMYRKKPQQSTLACAGHLDDRSVGRHPAHASQDTDRGWRLSSKLTKALSHLARRSSSSLARPAKVASRLDLASPPDQETRVDPVITGATQAAWSPARGERSMTWNAGVLHQFRARAPRREAQCAPDPRSRQRSGRPNPPPLRVSNEQVCPRVVGSPWVIT